VRRKKVALIFGVIATVPAALFAGALTGHFWFMHFVFKGDIRGFWAGDAFGDLLYSSSFGFVFIVLELVPWVRAYRRL
jgi:hypothetical protein